MTCPQKHPPRSRRALPAALAALGALATSLPSQQRGDRLLVCNRAEDTLSVFDPSTGRELAKLATGPAPNEVAVSPDGRVAVVTNARGGGPGASGPALTVIDVVAARVVRRDRLPRRGAALPAAHGVVIGPGGEVLTTTEADGRLLRIDATGAAIAAWTTGQRRPRLVALSRDGRTAATTGAPDGTVTFYDLSPGRAGTRTRTTKFGPDAEGLALHPATQHAWVTSPSADRLCVVSGATGEVLHTFDTGRAPHRVAFTPRGDRALVTCVLGGELMIFDGADPAPLAELSIHGDRSEESSLPLAVVSDPDGRRAYVTCARGEFVAVVDLAAAALVDRIDARRGPDGIAYARPRR